VPVEQGVGQGCAGHASVWFRLIDSREAMGRGGVESPRFGHCLPPGDLTPLALIVQIAARAASSGRDSDGDLRGSLLHSNALGRIDEQRAQDTSWVTSAPWAP